MEVITDTALAVNDYTVLKSVHGVGPRCFAETPDFDAQWPDDIADGHLVRRGDSV